MSGYPHNHNPSAPYGAPPSSQPYSSAPPYGAPAQPYGAPPAQPYGAPPAQPYGAPAQPYGAPAQPYGAPAQPYGAPAQPYGAPPQNKPPKEHNKPSSSPYGGPQPSGAYGSPFSALLPSTFPPGTDPNVVACFQVADQDGSGVIDDKELQRALSSYNQSFSIRTVHLLMYTFTNSNARRIGNRFSLYNSLSQFSLSRFLFLSHHTF
ncbi:putative calcium-binding protein CML48/49/50 [Helianthus annuus]|nr:putative calcium-binding protein CML48/49/50 [Helianthus annuus]